MNSPAPPARPDISFADAVGAWQVGRVHSVRIPSAGTIHRTFLIDTKSGAYVLRVYRYSDRTPIEREHTLIAHARLRGVRAIAPIPLPNHDTILNYGMHFCALFGRAPGRQVPAGALTAREAAAMGRCLAEMHRALADLPHGVLTPRTFAIDRAATLTEIDRLSEHSRQGHHVHDPVALHCLAGQRAYIESLPEDMAVDLAPLPFQPIHGDYTETNLFFEHGSVSAVIDWDQAYLAPRAWEVIRVLHLVFGFGVALGGAFLAAYRTVLPLAMEELDQAAAAYSVMRAHDLWIYQSIYGRGNERLRRFLTMSGSMPVAPRWAVFRAGYET